MWSQSFCWFLNVELGFYLKVVKLYWKQNNHQFKVGNLSTLNSKFVFKRYKNLSFVQIIVKVKREIYQTGYYASRYVYMKAQCQKNMNGFNWKTNQTLRNNNFLRYIPQNSWEETLVELDVIKAHLKFLQFFYNTLTEVGLL